nr:hypothetical protein [Tanacetum cinerariifolium]
MSSAFADTHNMVTILTKSDASEGFDQILDFLNGSYIKYALTVNPRIYISCIKQIWNTVTVKQSTDVTRLQALVDKKKVLILEAVIRDVLRLVDTEGVDCLPNEEIFTGLASMRYEKPSTKLTFYKAFFSSQWKFLIHTILQSLSAKRTSWNEFSSAMSSAVICLSTVEEIKEHSDEDEKDNVADATQGADTAYSGDDVQDQSIPSPTPPPQPPQDIPSTSQVAQDLEITKLKTRVKKLERANKVKPLKLRRLRKVGTFQRIVSSDDTIMEDAINQGRMIDELDRDEGVALMGEKRKKRKLKSMHEEESIEVHEVVEVVTTANLITKVVTAASAPVSAANTIIPAFEPNIPAVTITAAPVKVTAASTRRRRRGINCNNSCRNQEEENRALDSINETPAQKAAKRRRLNKEDKDVEEIKHHLEIVPNKDDDVYTEATPLARKVPVVDYQIIYLNNKPRYKIIRADGTHQLYVSFITLLKNFDREDLESLWSIVKERFSTSKPNNFSDDYLLTTLRAMFRRPDGQDQLILLVERRYPLLRFTLDQMLNVVTLQVEEQSEMSLELISFGVDAAKELEEKHQVFNAAGEELCAAKQKLMLLA